MYWTLSIKTKSSLLAMYSSSNNMTKNLLVLQSPPWWIHWQHIQFQKSMRVTEVSKFQKLFKRTKQQISLPFSIKKIVHSDFSPFGNVIIKSFKFRKERSQKVQKLYVSRFYGLTKPIWWVELTRSYKCIYHIAISRQVFPNSESI